MVGSENAHAISGEKLSLTGLLFKHRRAPDPRCCRDDDERKRLASTIFFFLFALDGAVLLVLLLAAPALSESLLGSRAYAAALRLMLLNTFAIGFTFIPFHVLRMTDRATTFVALTSTRSAATLLTRFALVVGVGMGVTGFVLADLVVTAIFTAIMLTMRRLQTPAEPPPIKKSKKKARSR